MTELHLGDQIEATFCPTRTDNLKPGIAEKIGERGRFEVAYRLDDEEWDNPDYLGQWACMGELLDYYWVPECDLADITFVRRYE